MIRFYNGYTLRFQPELRLTDEEVWIDGNSISYVGPYCETRPEFERQIDLKGDILMPGFKNAHSHTGMTFLRSLADDMELQKWLHEQVFPNEAKLTEESLYYFTKLGTMEYLTSGITASLDMYYWDKADAGIDCGFRTVLCSGLNNFDADPEAIERSFLKYRDSNELVSYMLGIHAEYTTSMERMEYMVSLAEKYKAPCFSHLCETKAEVDGCIGRYGVTPPQLLNQIGFYKYGGGGFHCCHFSEDDISLFREKGLYAVTCPASNLKLASGIAPVAKMCSSGVKVAIGTDGAASNNALDMFREMYLVAALQKVCENDAAAMPAQEVLKMACVHSADAMGLSSCNDIAPGKKADLIVIDMSRPNMHPFNNRIKNLVYSGSKENVRLTMINGKILYENGEFFIGDTPEHIYSKTEEFVRSLKP